MKVQGVVTFLLGFPLVCCCTCAGIADSSSGASEGLLFAASYSPGVTFSRGEAGFAGETGAVVGYRVGQSVEPWVAFLTGYHRAPRATAPGLENVSYGGISLGMNAHIDPQARLHPIISLELTAGTLLNGTGTGYNQWGCRFGVGGWFGLSRNLALTGRAFYGQNHRARWIGDTSTVTGGVPQSTGSAGVVFMLVFYPQIFP
jgi:hypothetical protein